MVHTKLRTMASSAAAKIDRHVFGLHRNSAAVDTSFSADSHRFLNSVVTVKLAVRGLPYSGNLDLADRYLRHTCLFGENNGDPPHGLMTERCSRIVVLPSHNCGVHLRLLCVLLNPPTLPHSQDQG